MLSPFFNLFNTDGERSMQEMSYLWSLYGNERTAQDTRDTKETIVSVFDLPLHTILSVDFQSIVQQLKASTPTIPSFNGACSTLELAERTFLLAHFQSAADTDATQLPVNDLNLLFQVFLI